MCSIFSPTFHIGLPGVSNPAPGELPSYRFQLQPQSNTPEPANHSLQGYLLISDRSVGAGLELKCADGSSPGTGLEIPEKEKTCKEYCHLSFISNIYICNKICVHVCPYMNVSVCICVSKLNDYYMIV